MTPDVAYVPFALFISWVASTHGLMVQVVEPGFAGSESPGPFIQCDNG